MHMFIYSSVFVWVGRAPCLLWDAWHLYKSLWIPFSFLLIDFICLRCLFYFIFMTHPFWWDLFSTSIIHILLSWVVQGMFDNAFNVKKKCTYLQSAKRELGHGPRHQRLGFNQSKRNHRSKIQRISMSGFTCKGELGKWMMTAQSIKILKRNSSLR